MRPGPFFEAVESLGADRHGRSRGDHLAAGAQQLVGLGRLRRALDRRDLGQPRQVPGLVHQHVGDRLDLRPLLAHELRIVEADVVDADGERHRRFGS